MDGVERLSPKRSRLAKTEEEPPVPKIDTDEVNEAPDESQNLVGTTTPQSTEKRKYMKRNTYPQLEDLDFGLDKFTQIKLRRSQTMAKENENSDESPKKQEEKRSLRASGGEKKVVKEEPAPLLSPTEAPPKRKGGRPRKNPLPSEPQPPTLTPTRDEDVQIVTSNEPDEATKPGARSLRGKKAVPSPKLKKEVPSEDSSSESSKEDEESEESESGSIESESDPESGSASDDDSFDSDSDSDSDMESCDTFFANVFLEKRGQPRTEVFSLRRKRYLSTRSNQGGRQRRALSGSSPEDVAETAVKPRVTKADKELISNNFFLSTFSGTAALPPENEILDENHIDPALAQEQLTLMDFVKPLRARLRARPPPPSATPSPPKKEPVKRNPAGRKPGRKPKSSPLPEEDEDDEEEEEEEEEEDEEEEGDEEEEDSEEEEEESEEEEVEEDEYEQDDVEDDDDFGEKKSRAKSVAEKEVDKVDKVSEKGKDEDGSNLSGPSSPSRKKSKEEREQRKKEKERRRREKKREKRKKRKEREARGDAEDEDGEEKAEPKRDSSREESGSDSDRRRKKRHKKKRRSKKRKHHRHRRQSSSSGGEGEDEVSRKEKKERRRKEKEEKRQKKRKREDKDDTDHLVEPSLEANGSEPPAKKLRTENGAVPTAFTSNPLALNQAQSITPEGESNRGDAMEVDAPPRLTESSATSTVPMKEGSADGSEERRRRKEKRRLKKEKRREKRRRKKEKKEQKRRERKERKKLKKLEQEQKEKEKEKEKELDENEEEKDVSGALSSEVSENEGTNDSGKPQKRRGRPPKPTPKPVEYLEEFTVPLSEELEKDRLDNPPTTMLIAATGSAFARKKCQSIVPERILPNSTNSLFSSTQGTPVLDALNPEQLAANMAEEEKLAGRNWIGRALECYWGFPANARGYYKGIITGFRRARDDTEYRVYYCDAKFFEWEVVDEGFRFLDPLKEVEVDRIIDLRKQRGAYEPLALLAAEQRKRVRHTPVGAYHQVDLAAALAKDIGEDDRGGELVWDPQAVSAEKVESFLERTKLDSSMVPSPFLMGRHDAQIWDFNKKILTQEKALQKLRRYHHNVDKAVSKMEAKGLKWSDKAAPIISEWTSKEVVMFETAMKKNPKDWRAMAQKLGKSHSEVIDFYYYWHTNQRYIDWKVIYRPQPSVGWSNMGLSHLVVPSSDQLGDRPRLRQRPRVEYSAGGLKRPKKQKNDINASQEGLDLDDMMDVDKGTEKQKEEKEKRPTIRNTSFAFGALAGVAPPTTTFALPPTLSVFNLPQQFNVTLRAESDALTEDAAALALASLFS